MPEEKETLDKYFIQCFGGAISHCAVTKKHRHSKLCTKLFDTPFHCMRYFTSSHLSRAVTYKGTSCFPCKKEHSKTGKAKRAHYHCPVCEKTILNRVRFTKHLKTHSSTPTPPVSTVQDDGHATDCSSVDAGNDGKNTDSFPEGGDIDCSDEAKTRSNGGDDEEEEHTSDMTRSKRNNPDLKECPFCLKAMHRNSLARHCREIHNTEIVNTATCVDEKLGLFLVRNSCRGGVAYPIHVQKVLGSGNVSIQCEQTECMDYMRVAWKSGLTAAECRHLEQVGRNPIFPEEKELLPSALNELSSLGAYRMLTDETIKRCTELKAEADRKKVRCLVSSQESSRLIHFSIYDGGVNYYSKFGRVVVTADIQEGTLDCRCCRRKRQCIHKCICLWFFSQHDMVDDFMTTYEENDKGHGSDDESTTSQLPFIGNLYPPTDLSIVATICKYLRENKRIPMYSLNTNPTPSLRLVPREKTCHFCSGELSPPIRISRKASILTMKEVVEGVETCYKLCDKCGLCYRYQETDLGIHNFNDIFLIGLDVCMFLRDCLQQHIPIGSIVKVLEGQLNKRINVQDVVNAYLHFNSLSEHAYDFCCLLCGYHPTILIMDLNKKVSFACNKLDLELPEDYDMHDADYIDCESFWEKVELSMVLRGFPNRNVTEFQVRTHLLSWLPFIRRMTRRSDLLVNTEHRKVDRTSGELERDCRDITEERLLEILHNSTVKEVISFANTLGLKPKGTKLDVILQVKHAISGDDGKFKKAFKKLWGCSGGWVSGTCPHGVIYALKFVLRAESPRGYVDLILSMAHQPNIIVSDMANMLVAHGNKRKMNMFRPFNGMVADPTQNNIKEALAGTLEVSLPWLDANVEDCKDKVPGKPLSETHPVSKSSQHLCLFDRLHEKNVKKDQEALRRVTNVKELKGKLNSQKDEQLHAAYNHDSRYLNQMKPVNHIFLFRSNIDVRNDKINQRLEAGLTFAFKHHLSLDENGQAVIDKTKPIVCHNLKKRQNDAISEEEVIDGQPPQQKRGKPKSSVATKGQEEEREMSDSSQEEDRQSLNTSNTGHNDSQGKGTPKNPIDVS